jgi:hypothetical protein
MQCCVHTLYNAVLSDAALYVTAAHTCAHANALLVPPSLQQQQPIKGIVSPAAMARMTVAEALTNLMWARVSSIDDIKARY